MKHKGQTVILIAALIGAVVIVCTVVIHHFSTLTPQGYTAQEIGDRNITYIDLNSADADTLASLPGIGEVLSGRIVAYRETHGDFTDPQDILNIDGIGQETYRRIAGFLVAEPSH